MNTKAYYLLVLLFCNLVNTNAQQNPYTFSDVDQVISLALQNNQDLAVFLLQQDKTTANHKIDKSLLLPTVSGTASFQNNLALQNTALPGEFFGQPGENINIQIGQQYNYNAGINLSKTILNREAMLKAKVSQIDIEIAEVNTELFTQTLKEQVSFYYYSVLVAKQAVLISQEDLKVSDSICQLTTQRFEEGLIDLTTKNQAEINRNKVAQSVLSNQNIYERSLNSLKLLLDIENTANIKFTEDLTPDAPTEFITFDLSADKTLVLKALQNEQSLLNIKKEKSAKIPTLSFNGYFGKQQLRDDFGLSFGNDAWSNYSYVGLNLNAPIFSGFSKKDRIKIATIDNQVSEKNLAIEQKKSTTKDAELLMEYNRNKAILQSSVDNFKLTKDNTDLAMLKYKEGMLSLKNYLNLYEDYLKAKNNYLNSLSAVYTQYATILSRK